jgi:hypothetical protein
MKKQAMRHGNADSVRTGAKLVTYLRVMMTDFYHSLSKMSAFFFFSLFGRTHLYDGQCMMDAFLRYEGFFDLGCVWF